MAEGACSELRNVEGLPASGSAADPSRARPISDAEEAWLQMTEEEAVPVVLEPTEGCAPLELLEEDAEEFDRNRDLREWQAHVERAWQERLADEHDAQEFAYGMEELVRRARLWEWDRARAAGQVWALSRGANLLMDKSLARTMDFDLLLAVQTAASSLVGIVEDARAELERQWRVQAFQEAEEARKRRERAEAALRADIESLEHTLLETTEALEQEKDKASCRICFTRPRNVLPLPCMHFQFCKECLAESQRLRRGCPTCRMPVSGSLVCHLDPG